MNHFNLLPPEIIEFIFKKLSLNNLINLRIVDKRFKEICEQIKIKQLIVSNNKYYQPFWFYTNDPTYYNSQNSIESSKFQNYAKIFQLNKHLRRLALSIHNFDFTILNEFKLLEHLEVRTNKLNDNYKLSLDHLKITDLDLYDYNSDFKLTFDTIKLFAFRFVKGNVVFKYPNKILFLEIASIITVWSFLYDNLLKKLNNLQYLKLHYLKAGSIGRNILSQLKNLKILDLFMDYFIIGDDDSVEDGDLVEVIKFIINEKEKLRRSEFEIYLKGVKLIDQNKFNQLKWSDDYEEFNCNLLEFQIKNYDLLKDNCSNSEINYCDLIKLIKIIPSSFTNKFPFIEEVNANDRVDNEDQFIKFLTNLQYLSKLELMNCELTQSFYDKLIDLVYLNNLERLTIKEKKDLEMNFDFILQLKGLKWFKTNQIITNHIDLIYKLSKVNKNIELFNFKLDLKNYIEIIKWNNSGLFSIRSYYLDDNLKEIYNLSLGNLKDLEDVILRLKELDNFILEYKGLDNFILKLKKLKL